MKQRLDCLKGYIKAINEKKKVNEQISINWVNQNILYTKPV